MYNCLILIFWWRKPQKLLLDTILSHGYSNKQIRQLKFILILPENFPRLIRPTGNSLLVWVVLPRIFV